MITSAPPSWESTTPPPSSPPARSRITLTVVAWPRATTTDLLDADPPPARPAGALAAYQRLAEMPDCPEFGYTLGQLYRHGEYLPGNLLPQDLDKARALIRPMAEDGYLPAFADLAEMEMRHANAREAMKWTQLYLYYVDKVLLPGIEDASARQPPPHPELRLAALADDHARRRLALIRASSREPPELSIG